MSDKHFKPLVILAVLLAMLVCGVAWCIFSRRESIPALSREIDVTIDMTSTKRGSLPLIGGYNYHLLKCFTNNHHSDIRVRLASRVENALDSLDAKVTDIVIMPFSDSLKNDSVHVAIPVDSAGVWVFRKSEKHNAAHFIRWLGVYRESPEYLPTRERFMGMYDPAKHTDRHFISPYDSLVRSYADTLGWDWRLLSAMIYCESHFKIEACSPRGATGLMQVMPGIALKKGHENLLDPESNIQAGTDILQTIMTKYRLWGPPEERIKYALASYNAGPGKVRRCVNRAVELGVDPSCWDNVASLMPNDPLDTAQTSQYLSQETVGYVRRVMYLYNRYRKICPEE